MPILGPAPSPDISSGEAAISMYNTGYWNVGYWTHTYFGFTSSLAPTQVTDVDLIQNFMKVISWPPDDIGDNYGMRPHTP